MRKARLGTTNILIGTREAAARLGVDISRIRGWVRDGSMGAIWVDGRVFIPIAEVLNASQDLLQTYYTLKEARVFLNRDTLPSKAERARALKVLLRHGKSW